MVEQDDGHQDKTFIPDKVLGHGDVIDCEEYKIEVIHTPGHASNHLCYLVHDASTLITGDHIMNGSTVVIAPPDGNMKQYLSSLKLLKDYAFDYIAPGHGDYLEDPVAVVDWIINHRLQRESKVHECLKKISPCDVNDLVKLVYDDVDPKLHPIALWSLTAHLEKLEEDGIAVLSEDKKIWSLN
jgi:glyoxylase-like metal-dependent hydrolase (beta-lactamase superfamily II)